MKYTILVLMYLLLAGCAVNRCPECGEPNIPVQPAPNSNLQLYRECVQTLPLDTCQQLARQWAMEDQLMRLEMQNAQQLSNQNMMLFNQYYQQYYGHNRR